jgi:protoporphyrinogen oxidase
VAKVGILGGGPAGLGVAHELSRSGHEVTLFEAAPEFGGLAGSFRFGDIDVERYYHFICEGDTPYVDWLDRLGLSSHLRWSESRTGFFYNGKLYPFSTALDLLRCEALTVPGRLRYGAFVLRCAATEDWHRLDGIPAKDWLIHNLGFDSYHVMWHPLLEIKFHEFHDKISAAWIWHRIHRVVRSRGRSMERERFGYLEGGTRVLIDALVEGARSHGARLLASTPAERVLHDGKRVRGVLTRDGTEHELDTVVSTVPLPSFLDTMTDLPARYERRLREIDFIGVVCVLLRLRRPLTDNYWLNVNDPRVPFNGCIEYTNLNPGVTGDGSTLLYVPYYVPHSSTRFGHSFDRNIEDTLAALAVINPSFSREWVLDAHVSRDRFAQVICKTGFDLLLPEQRTPVEGLYLLESSQLYPADRSISGTLKLATDVCDLLERDRR